MSLALSFQDIQAAMVLNQMGLSSRQEVKKTYSQGISLGEILNQWRDQKNPELSVLLEKFNPKKEFNLCMEKKIEMISMADPAYPELLRSIDDAPLILYACGQTDLLASLAIAIVGSRQASFYGSEQAHRFARVLADAGFTIVSGLALGIDQEAHEAALEAEGKTIAVLGCGINVVYPRENARLFERIRKQGLILSEYPLGAEPRAYHFPRRNRILSGLSLGVLVVEAHERSGSLITAYQALEQGREVFAIPGPVQHITARGTHRLIREGATLVEAPEEIIQAVSEHSGILQFQSTQKYSEKPVEKEPHAVALPELFSESKSEDLQPLLILLKQQSRDYEGLFELSNMEPQDFARTLTELEIEGKVRKNSSGYYEIS